MKPNAETPKTRHLVMVLGHQLHDGSSAFDGFDRQSDGVLMMEVAAEASYVPQHKIRLTLFFAAMRHFKEELQEKGHRVHYVRLEDANNVTVRTHRHPSRVSMGPWGAVVMLALFQRRTKS